MPDNEDRDELPEIDELLDAATITRLAYPRGKLDGMEPSAMQVLLALAVLSRPTVGEVATRLALRSPTVSVALAQLRNARFVAASTDADARRRRHILTAAGRRRIRRFLVDVEDELSRRGS
jgi:DNA-binding MarR family transcriptional regulator